MSTTERVRVQPTVRTRRGLGRVGSWAVGGMAVGGMALAATLLAPGVAAAYEVADGDTLSGIAARTGVSASTLAEANRIADQDRIIAGTELVIPGESGGGSASTSHGVRDGETLSGIASRYGVSASDLAAANGISDPDLIVSGVALALQGSGQAAPAPSSQTASAPQSDSAPRSTGRDTVRQLISTTAADYGWRPSVPLGLAMQESGWNNTVVSSAGAVGLFQVLPVTGEWVSTYLVDRDLDLDDPADNVAAGMAYLDYLYNRFDGNVEHAVAAYFEGPGRTEAAGGPSTPGAQRYVDNVLALAEGY